MLVPPLGFWPLGARGTVDELDEIEFTQLYGAWPDRIDQFEEEGSDDTMETAGSMVVGEAQYRTLFPAADHDYIAVELEEERGYDLPCSAKIPEPCECSAFHDLDGA